ncbi:hypothetical protein, partial [Mesotoga sp. HF07.pep.5.2.highcov]
MKLFMRNVGLPLSRLLSKALSIDSSFECEGIEISDISVDCKSKEIELAFQCDVSSEIKEFLESVFCEK